MAPPTVADSVKSGARKTDCHLNECPQIDLPQPRQYKDDVSWTAT
jgi:hypothetical protein